MRQIFTLIFFVVTTVVNAQNWYVEVGDKVDVYDDILGHTAIAKVENGYACLFKKHLWIVDEYGELMFVHKLPSITNPMFGYNQVISVEDGYLICGQETDRKIVYFKMNLQGEMVWKNTVYSPSNVANSPMMTLMPNGELVITSFLDIQKINIKTGVEIWKRSLNELVTSIVVEGDNYILSQENGLILKIDDSGQILSQDSVAMKVNEVIVTENGYWIGGAQNTDEMSVAFLDKSMQLQWEKTVGQGIVYDLAVAKDESVTIAARTDTGVLLMELTGGGDIIWQKIIGESQLIIKEVAIERANEGYVVAVSPRTILKVGKQGETHSLGRQLTENGATVVDLNNIGALIHPDGSLFQNTGLNYYKVPKAEGVSSIGSAGLMFGGFDESNILNISSNAPSALFKNFETGLLNDTLQSINRVWKITSEQIKNFRDDIADENLDDPIPFHLLIYPAKGNPHVANLQNNFVEIKKEIAPFIDVNQDGIYNIYDGDYPDIKGDMMLFWVFNDTYQFEVLASAYVYDCEENDLLYNTLFMDYELVNYSGQTIDSFFIGQWTDFELGCPTNDFYGCDSVSNSYFVYNETTTDGNCLNIPYYEDKLPIQSITLLNQPMTAFMVYPESGFNTFPYTDIELYNMMQAKWQDETPLTYGGDGYDMNGTITSHAFTGNPAKVNEWSFCADALNASSLITVGSSGFHTIKPNERFNFSIALSTHHDVPQPCPDIEPISESLIRLQTMFENDEIEHSFYLGADTTIVAGETITLMATDDFENYDWSTTEKTSTINVSETGNYSLITMDKNGCLHEDNIEIIVDDFYVNKEDDISIVIYPNPTRNNLNVNYLSIFDDLEFSILDALGQQVYIEKNAIAFGAWQIDVSGLAAGVYFLHIAAAGEVKKVEKFIIVSNP